MTKNLPDFLFQITKYYQRVNQLQPFLDSLLSLSKTGQKQLIAYSGWKTRTTTWKRTNGQMYANKDHFKEKRGSNVERTPWH